MRVVLASKSPARLAVLKNAGIPVEKVVSEVDESRVTASDIKGLVSKLATLKAQNVWDRLDLDEPTIVIGCDSILEFDGRPFGKPGTPEKAIKRWRKMRRRQGVLHTGHHVKVIDDAGGRSATRVASTIVTFADLSDEEIAAYVATGEPEGVAGGFTIDSYGAPFITRIEGDPHNVVGISLPLVRQMLLDLSVVWHTLWITPKPTAN